MPPSDDRFVLTPVPGEQDLGLVDALAQLSFVVQGVLGQVAAAEGLSIIQARLLGILRDRQPTIKELANLLNLDKSSVTGLVDRAEERGFVQRTPSPVDGRSVRVTITSAGRAVIDRGGRAFENELTALVADVSPAQRARLSAIATLIVAADARRRGMEIFGPR